MHCISVLPHANASSRLHVIIVFMASWNVLYSDKRDNRRGVPFTSRNAAETDSFASGQALIFFIVVIEDFMRRNLIYTR